MANEILKFTGDWVNEINCEDIQQEGRENYDEVIYFGPKSDLRKTGKAYILNIISMEDRHYRDGEVGFFYNSDKKCLEKYRENIEMPHWEDIGVHFDPSKAHLGIFRGKNSVPTFLEWKEDTVENGGFIQFQDGLDLKSEISIITGTPTWSP